MKGKLIILYCFLLSTRLLGQDISTNRHSVSLEHNLLFNASSRYTVTQSGTAQINLAYLFDGRMNPSYSSIGIDENNPTIIEISGLPSVHIQAGAWFGWSTRYWMPTRFLMEAYDVYYGNGWVTVADYTNIDYTGNHSIIKSMPQGAYTKLRLTIYKSNGADGKFGLSELFFIHPEATRPYQGLLESDQIWMNNGTSLYYSSGNIGIGTDLSSNPNNYKLAVNGAIGAKEVKIEMTSSAWSDFVFDDNYNLRSLREVENYINEQNHLPDIPTAYEVEKNGFFLGEMNAKLLQKIEELTLYTIQQEKELQKQRKINKELELRLQKIETIINKNQKEN